MDALKCTGHCFRISIGKDKSHNLGTCIHCGAKREFNLDSDYHKPNPYILSELGAFYIRFKGEFLRVTERIN